jgi:hypothetical protein
MLRGIARFLRDSKMRDSIDFTLRGAAHRARAVLRDSRGIIPALEQRRADPKSRRPYPRLGLRGLLVFAVLANDKYFA